MSSFRNYSDTGSFRTRTGIGAGSTFGRNASTGSSYSNYRNSYTGLGSASVKTAATKERSIGSSYGTNFSKKDGDKVEEKPSYKYSCTKNSEKDRATPTKISKEDTRTRSRSSNAGPTSILEKYTLGSRSSHSTERPSSVLDRYRTGSASREVSREPDSLSSRYGGTTSYSESSRSYGSDKKDKEPTYRTGLRPPAREPSPEVGIKAPGYRVYSRTPTFGKSTSTSESLSTPLSTRYSNGSASNGTTSGRYSLSTSRANPEHVTASIGYTTAERFRSPTVKSTPSSVPEDVPSKPLETPVMTEAQPVNGSRQTNTTDHEHADNGNDNSTSSAAEESHTEDEVVVVTVVTRGTSPTPPPALTAYTRTKRLEPAPKPVRKEVKKSEIGKVETREQEQQVDRSSVEAESPPSRYSSRYSSGASSRVPATPWVSSYLDKYGANSCSTSTSNSCTPRTSYAGSSPRRVTGSYGYNSRSRSDDSSSAYASKDSSTRSTSSSLSEPQSRPSSSQRRLAQRTGSEDRSRSDASQASSRIVEGQDHGQGSRRESSSRASDGGSGHNSPGPSRPGSVTRSGSLKSRHLTSPGADSAATSASSAVSLPTGCSAGRSSGKAASVAASSTSSAGAAAAAASPTKIKSAAATSTASAPPSASSSSNSSKCASAAGSSAASSSSRQAMSPDARDRKPPVPKSEMVGKSSAGGPGPVKYVNKDFRKSALNMENGDPSRSQICERKLHKKCQRSVSVSSQDSQSEANSESAGTQQVASSGSSGSIRSSKSKSKTPTPESASARKPELRKSSSKSPCNHNGQNGRISRTMSVSTSECSTENSSSESSESEEDEENAQPESRRAGARRRRTSDSPFAEGKGKMSAGSSRTSVLASSADELSVNSDKPPRPPSSPRSRSDKSGNKTDEAKSFLMRALAPVTKLFKSSGKQESGADIRNGGWVEACSEENSDGKRNSKSTQSLSKSRSFANGVEKSGGEQGRTRTRQQSSGEKPWWLDPNSDNVPDGVERNPSRNDDVSQDTTISTVLPDDGKFKFNVWRQDSEERSWWLDDNDNNILLDEQQNSLKEPPPPSPPNSNGSLSRKGSTRSARSSPRQSRANRLRHQQSGERAWWLSDDPDVVPEGVEVIPVSPAVSRRTTTTESSSDGRPIGNRIRHIESGERPWWLDSSSNIPEGVQEIHTEASNSNSDSSESFDKVEIGILVSEKDDSGRGIGFSRFPLEDEPLGDRASPEGIENPPDPPDNYGGRMPPYDNVTNVRQTPPRRSAPRKRPANLPLFIGNSTNIDDLLGDIVGPGHSPMMPRNQKKFSGAAAADEPSDNSSDEEEEECEEIDAAQVIIHDSTPQTPVIQRRLNRDTDRPQPDGYIPLDDTALQLYKDGDYGAYLDLEASISEQQEEFEGFQTNRKNSIVLRTQLSVRVHTIIEKLLNSEGRELRRALFSLKQIFQEDKDLVHEFVQNDGLACLIKVGSEADQNYQNYILRALGQVMLYVDGMNGVMEHGQTVQWLYTLIASRFRLVVKTALKLLLVFVEYVETNSLLLVRAIRSVDTSRGMIPWTNVMKLLKDYDAADTELLIYATTLVNKCLNGIPDQDTYYDQVDCLEEQGIEGIIQRYMSKQGTDLDLLRQFQIYEAVLHHEDGNDRDSPIRQLDDNIRKTLRNRKSLVDSHERRKSRRHSTGTSPLSMALNSRLCSSPRLNNHNTTIGLNTLNKGLSNGGGLDSQNCILNSSAAISNDEDDESSSSQSSQGLGEVQMNGSYKENKGALDVGVTPALRRRRERAERQRSFIREQQEATANMRASIGHPDEDSPFNGICYTNGTSGYEPRTNGVGDSNKLARGNSRKDLTPLMNAANKLDTEEKKQLQQQTPWYGKSPDEGVECDEGNHTADEDEDRRVVLQLKREGTVKDLTQKLTAQNLIPNSPVEEKVSRIGDVSGLISKAKEGLAKSKSKADVLKSPTNDNLPKLTEVKKSENELHWEELVNKLKRPLNLCDLDFTDLNSDDEIDVLGPVNISNGVPPPPPPMAASPGSAVGARAPPPPPPSFRAPPPLPTVPPPLFGVNLKSTALMTLRSSPTDPPKSPVPPPQQQPSMMNNKKSKKTVKLFWKEVRDDPIILSRLDKNKMIWDELSPIPVDTQKLEHLFESRAKDLITKKQQEMNKNKEIIVLDHKRSNAINIGMTKLPPPRSIKTAILKMDATIMNREGIEKLLTMLPTEEERSRIQEAQAANPDLPLGSAEQFLLTLASISELPARLKLWAFKLDFENSEKEIADPLMDLKQGMETLRVNKTFRGILSTLLSIGIFLNGNEVKGFQLEYLAKVPEVKDTVHKHSLLHHLCHMVMEKFPDSTDLYSEIGAVTRASKIDFDELASNIGKLESECKASWDHLKLITKHDGSTMMKVKMSEFLADCAERIIVLSIVHRRIINRFHKFILWLGIPLHRVQDTKPNEFCRIVSEFALEYRTTRERVIQQLEKKANHRERNKTRGKMITEVGKFRTKEDRADAELRQLLGSDISDVESIHGTLPWRRQRKDGRTSLGPLLRDEHTNGNLTDGDDELLESLVKTATKTPATRTTPRERKRTRHADRKSLRRTLKNGLSEEEKKHIAAYIKGY
ncbi:uncharacterized protein LOC100115129 isoform X2 [Nasonia vitripennis]|uniref:FH1/FH2 domain-containing protein 3 n=1 Tax=Nasonia vitripennis TaxID=7425 RepID=A0A7M7Q0L8_NASVI|nr:uncharacterized protein LOC100115129 isoform X2 [Nasonia vitripennis]